MIPSGAVLLAVLVLLIALPIRRTGSHASRSSPFSVATLTLIFGTVALDLATWPRAGGMVAACGLGGTLGIAAWLTYPLFHASLLHLAGNVVALWLIGPGAESAVGSARLLAVALASSTAAGLVHLLLASGSDPLVGASGAVFGLLGLSAVRFWRTRISLGGLVQVPSRIVFAVALGLQAVLAISRPGDVTAYAAHLGGALCGGLLALPLRLGEAGLAAELSESAQAAEGSGELALAAAHYRELIRLRPLDPDPQHRLALLSLQLNDRAGALDRFGDALRLAVAAGGGAVTARILSDCLAVGGESALSAPQLLSAAATCEGAGEFPRAIQALSAVCRLYDGQPEGESAQIRLARLYLQKLDRPADAAAILRELVRTAPESAWIGNARALLSDAERQLSRNP